MDSYDQATATHYAAFRPPLHRYIVHDALGGQRFETGLDIGCGTGWSTVALASVCQRAIGVDSSPAMLAEAAHASGVEYRLGDACDLPVEPRMIDLVSLAGVLSYIDRSSLVAELRRVCRPAAAILIYDFRVELQPLLQRLSIDLAPSPPSYDHARNLSGDPGVETIHTATKRMSFASAPGEAAHIILSSGRRLKALAKRLDAQDPYERTKNLIEDLGDATELEASVWIALHRLR